MNKNFGRQEDFGGYIAVNILIPYPGTEFYKKFEKEGRIICTDYTKYTGNTVIIKPP